MLQGNKPSATEVPVYEGDAGPETGKIPDDGLKQLEELAKTRSAARTKLALMRGKDELLASRKHEQEKPPLQPIPTPVRARLEAPSLVPNTAQDADLAMMMQMSDYG